jgi:hypothetical protein
MFPLVMLLAAGKLRLRAKAVALGESKLSGGMEWLLLV